MLELVLVVVFGFLAFRATTFKDIDTEHPASRYIDKLWGVAQLSMREKRFMRAEKALLTILKIDQKNAAAYNRLGILYAKQKEYKDAIECFYIAKSLDPSPNSFHNLGLIYYEVENFEKAAIAFEEALKFDEQIALRHIAYAKVQEKLGNHKLMIQELEKASELEPNPETLGLLMRAYESNGMHTEAEVIKTKMGKLIMPAGKPRRVLRPRKVVI